MRSRRAPAHDGSGQRTADSGETREGAVPYRPPGSGQRARTALGCVGTGLAVIFVMCGLVVVGAGVLFVVGINSWGSNK
jgi:hypothetical protein